MKQNTMGYNEFQYLQHIRIHCIRLLCFKQVKQKIPDRTTHLAFVFLLDLYHKENKNDDNIIHKIQHCKCCMYIYIYIHLTCTVYQCNLIYLNESPFAKMLFLDGHWLVLANDSIWFDVHQSHGQNMIKTY